MWERWILKTANWWSIHWYAQRRSGVSEVFLNCFAISISLGLQHGCPRRVYRRFCIYTFWTERSVMGHSRIKMATSVIDFIFPRTRRYLSGRNDLAHVEENELPKKSEHRSIAEPDFESEEIVSERTIDWIIRGSWVERLTSENPAQKAMAISLHQNVIKARERGYTGDICPECQSMTMVRNGNVFEMYYLRLHNRMQLTIWIWKRIRISIRIRFKPGFLQKYYSFIFYRNRFECADKFCWNLFGQTELPAAKGDAPGDKPSLTYFLPQKDKSPGTAVLICPGGGYGFLAADYEGDDVARWFNSFGVTGIVLRYRHRHSGAGYQYPAPLNDARRALSVIRSRAGEIEYRSR